MFFGQILPSPTTVFGRPRTARQPKPGDETGPRATVDYVQWCFVLLGSLDILWKFSQHVIAYYNNFHDLTFGDSATAQYAALKIASVAGDSHSLNTVSVRE